MVRSSSCSVPEMKVSTSRSAAETMSAAAAAGSEMNLPRIPMTLSFPNILREVSFASVSPSV